MSSRPAFCASHPSHPPVRAEETGPSKNPIAALYPLTKLSIALCVSALALLLPGLPLKAALLAALFVLAAVSACVKLFAARMVSSVGVLVAVLFLIQTFFYAGGTPLFTVGFLTAKREGVLFAAELGLNLACVAGALVWLFSVTEERDLVLALEKRGLGPKASYVVLSAFLMVPVLKRRSEAIMCAQRARGVETEGGIVMRARAFVPTLVPLVLSSIAGTEERSLTLEARGFSVEGPRTHLHDLEPGLVDGPVTACAAAVLAAALAGRIALWLI